MTIGSPFNVNVVPVTESPVPENPVPENQWTWSFESRIAGNSDAGREVIDQMLKQLIKHKWQEHDTFGVHLAIEEAVANAIKHGNQGDSNKTVHVDIRVSADRVRIEVADQGGGFDPNDVPDPTDQKNLELPTGRGLMLMRSYMTSVQFNEQGNCVVMEKFRSTAQ